MPTQNRRIATYLPKDVDKKFQAFKLERGLNGDSPALITILKEFLGVSQEAAHLHSSEFNELSAQISELTGELAVLRGELF